MKSVTIRPRWRWVAALRCLSGSPMRRAPRNRTGLWLRPSTGSQVRFYNCGGKLCGKMVAVTDQARKGEIGK